MRYGIAFTDDGSPVGAVLNWRQKNGQDEVWGTFADALEANDLGGWTGYVRRYPSGERISPEESAKILVQEKLAEKA